MLRRPTERHLWIVALLLLCVACSGKATEDDLQLWKHTKKGRKKIANEVVRNTQQDFKIRVRAIEILVEHGHVYDARDALKDAPGYLEMLNALVPPTAAGQKKGGVLRFLYTKKRTKKARIRQLASRDFLFMSIRLLGAKNPKLTTRIKNELIAWTFSGLNLKLPLNKKNQPLLIRQGVIFLQRTGYIENLRWLGALAAEPLCDLIRQNVEVRRIVKLMVSMKNKSVNRKAIKALSDLAFNPVYPVGESFIEMVRSLNTDDAAILLMRLGSDPKRVKDSDVRDTAIENAKYLAKKLSSSAILPHFYKMMARKGKPEARFYAALDILEMAGVTDLGKVLSAFKNDGLYGTSADARAENINNFLYFSLQTVRFGSTAIPPLVAQLKSKNPISRVLAILCLKTLGDKRAIPALKKLKEDTTEVKWFADKLTVARLAQNAIDAIPVFARIHKIARSNKLPQKQLHNLILAVCQNLADIGDDLVKDMYKNLVTDVAALETKLYKPKGKKCCKVCSIGTPCGDGCAPIGKPCVSKKPLCACKVTKFLVKDKLGLLKELLATVVKPEPEAPKKKKKKRRRRRRR